METLEETVKAKTCHQCREEINGRPYISPYKSPFCNEGCYNLFVSD